MTPVTPSYMSTGNKNRGLLENFPQGKSKILIKFRLAPVWAPGDQIYAHAAFVLFFESNEPSKLLCSLPVHLIHTHFVHEMLRMVIFVQCCVFREPPSGNFALAVSIDTV